MAKVSNVTNLPIPDLRFEQTFVRSLTTYATKASQSKPLTRKQLEKHNDGQIQMLNESIDEQEQNEIDGPLPVITPAIITYAIIKDQILMPLIQGFLFSGFLILVKPFLRQVVLHGQQVGSHLAVMLGVNQLTRRG